MMLLNAIHLVVGYTLSMLVSRSCSSSYSASFYGNSFLFERLSDNSADTTLSLQFQTRALDGIILIAAGQRDYLIVSLKHGRLEIRINTGYGEGVLKTTSKEKYNNLLWHEVQLTRHARNVWVDINKKNIITSTLQAGNREYDLNIDLGVFLGGFDRNVGSSYVGKLEQFFRGCILSAVYNDVDVLDPIMSVGNHKFAHNVDAGCSNIFRAQPNQPMSFTSAESFLKLPTWPTSDDEALFECRLRTLGQDGLIMFSSGATRSEFVMMELSKGHIRGSINRGSGVVALQSTMHVNDGRWHRVRLKLKSSVLEIHVGRNKSNIFIEQRNSGNIDMTGGMYIGGMDRSLKQQTRSSGIQTQSFPGCFKNLRVNRIRKTFKDFTTTHLLNVGCPSNMTTLPHAQSSSQVVPNFVIVPHTQPRTSHKPSSTMVTRGQQRHVCFQQTIHNIELMEGGRVDLSDEMIRFDLMSDRRRLRNDNSMQFLTFNLTQPPLHGGLVVGGQGVVGGDALVMQDIHDGRLTYVHNGSETRTDRIVYTVGTTGLDASIRAKDSKEYHLCNTHHETIPPSMKYSLNISIIPVDDPPVLFIPANYTFTPIRNARTPLPTHILRSYDPDSDPSDIIYHILSGGVGWHIASTTRPVDSFTQTQVDRGEVDFVHANGPDRVRLLVQVTNSNATLLSSTSTYVMRISTKPIQVTVSHSRGLVLVEGEAKLITLQQLNVSTNAGSAQVDVKYRVVSPPLYGHIQVYSGNDEDKVSSGVWSQTDHFFHSHLRDNHVRYLNVDAPDTSGRLIGDRFHFTVGAAGYESEPAVFNISIVKVLVSISTSGVKLEAGNTGFLLTPHALDVRHYGLVGVSDDDIRFFILAAPVHGNLFYGDTGLRISYGGSFTLGELRNNRIQYEVNLPRSTQPLHDHIELNAVIRDHYRSQPSTLNITYQPDTKSIQITSELVEVDEGGEAVITSDQLFARTLLHNRFAFLITQQPTHGTLYMINPPNVGNLTTFTTQDILEHRLKYRHDGSETPQDFLAFTLHPITGGEEALMSGVLNISIHLLNDHPPVRVVNQPFHLPQRGERLLTPHDIWYHDPDISDDDRDLKFVRRGISNGDLLNATTLMKIFEFSQKDIASSGVLFRHRGRDFGRFVFWVKDGKHFATGLFVVVASPPYLHVTNHSKLMVERSSSAAITSNHISISTNVDGWPRNVGFSITTPPAHGNLVIGDSPVTTFTQADINHGNLIYRHDGSEGKRDIFHFDIRVGSTTAHGNVSVRIYLASEMLPPVLKRNEMIVVHQNSSVVLTRSTLRAHHSTTRTKDLTFTLTRPPVYGSVVVTSATSPNITTFTQWDINQGLVVYQQDGNISDDIVTPSDGFEFTVSNGIMSSTGEVHVEIIPSGIPLRCGNFSVGEGGSRILISDYLGMHNGHYDADNINVRVVEQPRHGQLESARDTGVQLREFPLRLAQAEFVYYVHDGSDTLYDSYKLQASTIDGSKTSRIMTSHITIIPDNDEAPYIVNNTGMEVWVNSTTMINEAQLTAVDPDTPPSMLQYSILPPLNGHLVLSTHPHQPLHNFTQQQINDGQLLFVHQGSYTGGFTFQVGDGRNYGVKQIFIIRARPLVISISGSHIMPVFPGTTSALQPSVMHGGTNAGEGNSHGVTFHVNKPPHMGELVKLLPPRNATTGPPTHIKVTSFTQEDIETGAIIYNQTEVLDGWSMFDDIVLSAHSPPAMSVHNIHLSINITYDAYQHANRSSAIQTNTVAVVGEGGKVNLTTHHIDASNLLKKYPHAQLHQLRYKVKSMPSCGLVSIQGTMGAINTTFGQADLAHGRVVYTHDGSEHFKDWFDYEAWVEGASPNAVGDRFTLTITPVNDNMPLLITKSPSIEVVQGFIATIGQKDLEYTDVDNPPQEVRYKVIRPPTHGRIMLLTHTTPHPVDSFTQRDINQRKLIFDQNGSGLLYPADEQSETPDAFYYSVADGTHRPSVSLLRIMILPISIHLTTSTLEITQGDVVAPITQRVINGTTNGRAHHVIFSLTTPPSAGTLMLDNHEVDEFKMADLGHVIYFMDDITHAYDHMRITMTYYDETMTYHPNITATVPIKITPLVNIDSFTINTHQRNVITTDVLDASQLADTTNSMPYYTIIGGPNMSDIIVERGGGMSSDTASHSTQRRSLNPPTFTHLDVVEGRVAIHPHDIQFSNLTHVLDGFQFRLEVDDHSVSPAIGHFHFTIVPHNNSLVEATTMMRSMAEMTEETTIRSDIPTTTTTTPTISTTPSSTIVLVGRTTSMVKALEVEEVKDGRMSWLIPLIIALSILLALIIAALIICCICIKPTRGPAYVKGHESTLAPHSDEYSTVQPSRATIDATTSVKVTSQTRLLKPSQCPTAPVVVTPLGEAPSHDDVTNLSTSVPHDSLLSNHVINGFTSSARDFRDYFHPVAAEMRDVYSSDESLTSQGEPPHMTSSMGSLYMGGRGLSTTSPVQQFWV